MSLDFLTETSNPNDSCLTKALRFYPSVKFISNILILHRLFPSTKNTVRQKEKESEFGAMALSLQVLQSTLYPNKTGSLEKMMKNSSSIVNHISHFKSCYGSRYG